MAAKGPRENITLECTECKRRNYMTSKNKRNNTERLEVAKQLVNNTAAVVVIVIITVAIVFALDFAFEALNKYGINPIKSKVRGTNTVVEQNIDETNNAVENAEANNDVQNVNGTVVENNSAENSNNEVTEESWYIVRNTRGVTGFVGSGTDPIPLTDEEIRSMGFETANVNVDYDVDESVRILNGPLSGFIGTVQEINKNKGKVKVLVSMFGRETPVELEFSQVEKL